jgi:hypothetical protein
VSAALLGSYYTRNSCRGVTVFADESPCLPYPTTIPYHSSRRQHLQVCCVVLLFCCCFVLLLFTMSDEVPSAAAAAAAADAFSMEKELWEILLDVTPADETQAVRQAVQQNMAGESPPLRNFIGYEQGNLWAAAHRLRAYWRERQALFGEPAYGPWWEALSKEERCLLTTSDLILPKVEDTASFTLFINLNNLNDPDPSHRHSSSEEATARILFCWMHHLSCATTTTTTITTATNTSTTDTSTTALAPSLQVVVRENDLQSVDVKIITRLVHVLFRAFPLQLKVLHVLGKTEKKKADRGNFSSLSSQWPRVLQKVVHYHEADTTSNNLYKVSLQNYGIADLPQTWGGNLTWDGPSWWASQGFAVDVATTTTIAAAASQPANDMTDSEIVSDGKLPAASDAQSSRSGTSAEQDDAMDDAMGTEEGDYILESTSTQETGLRQLQEAIDMMEESPKAAYLEALRECPHLVVHEIPALWFLQYDHYDAWAAARRLTLYWERRKAIFGNRAFLPMSQTGGGTLDTADLESLWTGYLALLPEDDRGRAVLCYDASRLTRDSRESRLRCLFYMVSVLMEEQINRRDGFPAIGIMNNVALTRSFGMVAPVRLMETLPVTCTDAHGVRSQLSPSFFQSAAAEVLKVVNPSKMRKVKIHTGNEAQVLKSLQQAGLAAGNLPTKIGGEWTYDSFTEWCEERCQFELEKYPSLQKRKGSLPQLAQPTGNPSPAAEVAKNALRAFVSHQAKEEKVTRRRQLRVMYSRQKRERQKGMVDSLHEQAFDLQSMNRFLKDDNSHLEELLRQAQELAGGYLRFLDTPGTDAPAYNFERTVAAIPTPFLGASNIMHLQAHFHRGRISTDASTLPLANNGFQLPNGELYDYATKRPRKAFHANDHFS